MAVRTQLNEHQARLIIHVPCHFPINLSWTRLYFFLGWLPASMDHFWTRIGKGQEVITKKHIGGGHLALGMSFQYGKGDRIRQTPMISALQL